MKTLLLIRHAKSSWDKAILQDQDRPLSDRGRKDAPEMARRLLKKGIPIDLFVSSPARRARETAHFFIREYKGKEEDILLVPKLYHPDLQTFEEVISALDDKYEHVAIFSHNPGITAFVNSLSMVSLDNIPTCGVFALTIDIPAWKRFSAAGKKFLLFDYPKSLQD